MKLVEERRHVKKDIYEESKKTVDVQADSWQSRLHALSMDVVDVAPPLDDIHAFFNVPLAPVTETQTRSGSQSNSGESFQFDAKPESPEAGPEPNFFNWSIATW